MKWFILGSLTLGLSACSVFQPHSAARSGAVSCNPGAEAELARLNAQLGIGTGGNPTHMQTEVDGVLTDFICTGDTDDRVRCQGRGSALNKFSGPNTTERLYERRQRALAQIYACQQG